jgi:hypothetical protein
MEYFVKTGSVLCCCVVLSQPLQHSNGALFCKGRLCAVLSQPLRHGKLGNILNILYRQALRCGVATIATVATRQRGNMLEWQALCCDVTMAATW